MDTLRRIPLLFCFAGLWGCAAPSPPPPLWETPSITSYASPGRHRVAIEQLKLTNEELGKELGVRLSFPRSDGTFPVVLFSHGAYSSKDLYGLLLDHWASHGYVVLAPTHRDSTTLGVERGDPSVGAYWSERMADLSFLLNSMLDIENRVGALRDKPDLTRVAVTGHSLGGLTAMAMAGARVSPDPATPPSSYRDSRVKAAIFVSPPGALPGLVDRAGFSGVTVPALYTTATNDILMLPDTTWEWHKDGYLAAPAGDKYLLVLKGADHYLGGMVGRDDLEQHPMSDDFLDVTNGLSTAFLDSYLKGSPRAQDTLRSSGRLVSPTVALIEMK